MTTSDFTIQGTLTVNAELDRLRQELATARKDALLSEQDAVRWRKFISFDCLALHLPIIRANSSMEIGTSTADAMDRLIDAIDCEPAIRALAQPAAPTTDKAHPEDFCQRCQRPNVTWFAPSEIWNKAVRAVNAEEILCPVCFIQLAEHAGFNKAAWRIAPEVKQPAAPSSVCPNCKRPNMGLRDEVETARRTAEYWKAEHLAGNAKLDRLLAENERLRQGRDAEIVYIGGLREELRQAKDDYDVAQQAREYLRAEKMKAVTELATFETRLKETQRTYLKTCSRLETERDDLLIEVRNLKAELAATQRQVSLRDQGMQP